jgi:putative thioredoxin
MAGGETEVAREAYLAVLQEEKDNAEAAAGLAKCHIALEQFDEAEQVLASLPVDKQSAEPVVAARAALALAKAAPKASELAALEKAVAQDPQDYQARFDLAVASFPAGKREEAINDLLFIIAKDKNWKEGAAKAQLLTFFEALGFGDPLAVQGRRRLSSILFA